MKIDRLALLKAIVSIPFGVLSIAFALDYGMGSQAAYYVEQGEPMFYVLVMLGFVVGLALVTYGLSIFMREDVRKLIMNR